MRREHHLSESKSWFLQINKVLEDERWKYCYYLFFCQDETDQYASPIGTVNISQALLSIKKYRCHQPVSEESYFMSCVFNPDKLIFRPWTLKLDVMLTSGLCMCLFELLKQTHTNEFFSILLFNLDLLNPGCGCSYVISHTHCKKRFLEVGWNKA